MADDWEAQSRLKTEVDTMVEAAEDPALQSPLEGFYAVVVELHHYLLPPVGENALHCQ